MGDVDIFNHWNKDSYPTPQEKNEGRIEWEEEGKGGRYRSFILLESILSVSVI